MKSLFLFISAVACASAIEYDNFGFTKLHNLCLEGRLGGVKSVIEDAKGSELIDVPDLRSQTRPLHILVEKAAVFEDPANVVELTKLLVSKGASLTAQTDSGWTALNKAIYLASDYPNYPLEIVDILLKAPGGCGAVKLQTRGRTSLHFAAASRLPDNRAKVLVDKLIAACGKEIDFGSLNSDGWTALKVAISVGNTEVIHLLKSKTPLGWTVFIYGGIILLALLVIGGVAFYFFKKPSETKKNKKKPVTGVSDNQISEAAQVDTEPVQDQNGEGRRNSASSASSDWNDLVKKRK